MAPIGVPGLGQNLLGLFKYAVALLGEAFRYLGRSSLDLVSGVRLVLLRRARRRSPERAGEYDRQIDALGQQRAARWAEWRTLPGRRRFEVRLASLLITAATVWAVPHFASGPGMIPGGTTIEVRGGGTVRDLLVLRAGAIQQGSLQVCSGETCTLDGRSVRREEIAWIGVRGVELPVPAVGFPAKDEVHLRDGSFHHGRLVGISAASVATERGSYEREKVAWVYLAPPPEHGEEPGPHAKSRAPDSPGEEPALPRPAQPPSDRERASPKRETGRPTTLAPRSEEDAIRPCPRERPLGGRFEIEAVVTEVQQWRFTTRARFWFRLAPRVSLSWPYVLSSVHNADAIVYDVSSSACAPQPNPSGEVWSCPGGRSFGTASLAGRGSSVGFSPTEPGLDISLPDPILDGLRRPLRCEKPLGCGGGRVGHGLGGLHRVETRSDYRGAWFITPATGCREGGRKSEACSRRPDLYAAIPWVGEGRRTTYTTQSHRSEQARWQVCCGCGESPKGAPGFDPQLPQPSGGPERPPAKDDCKESSPHRAQMDLLWTQRQAMAKQLENDWRGLQTANAEVQFNQLAWRAAIAACAINDIVSETLEAAIGALAKNMNVPDFAQAAEMLYKITTGDLSYLGRVQTDAAGESVLEKFIEYYQRALPAGPTGGFYGNLRAKLNDCSTPLPDNLAKGARAFVDNLEKVARLMPKVQEQINHIRNKDRQYWEEWHKYYSDCLAYAECKGLPATICQPPPESPGGPMRQ